MKSFLIIGIGRFAHYLCRELAVLGNEIVIADVDEHQMDDLFDCVVSAKIGDCTRREVVASFGVNNFDACFVCIGTNFQNSLQVTDLLKEMGARRVISRATTDIHAKFLLRSGADEVVFPDRDVSERIAVRASNDSIFDYIELSDELAIYEIPPQRSWLGRSISEVNVRAKYNINILAFKKNGRTAMPAASHIFTDDEHLMVLSGPEDIKRLV
jgi:trk system potassium uptake protein TrkA